MPRPTKKQQQLTTAQRCLTQLHKILYASLDLRQVEIPEIILTALAQLEATLDYVNHLDSHDVTEEALRHIYQQVKQLRLPHSLDEQASKIKTQMESMLSVYTISTNATHSPSLHSRPLNTSITYLALLKQKITEGDALALLRFIAEYVVNHIAERLELAGTPITAEQVVSLYQEIIGILTQNDTHSIYANMLLANKKDDKTTTASLNLILKSLCTDSEPLSILKNDLDILPLLIATELESSPGLLADSRTFIRGTPNRHARITEIPVELLRAATYHLTTDDDETLLTMLARGRYSALPAPPRYPLSRLKDPTPTSEPTESTTAIMASLVTTPKTDTDEEPATATSSTTAGSSSGSDSASPLPEIPSTPERAQELWLTTVPIVTKARPEASGTRKSALTKALANASLALADIDEEEAALLAKLAPKPSAPATTDTEKKEPPSLHIDSVPQLTSDTTLDLEDKLHALAEGITNRETLALQVLCCEVVFNALLRDIKPAYITHHYTVLHFALHIIFGLHKTEDYTPISVTSDTLKDKEITTIVSRIVSDVITRLHKVTAGEYSKAPLLEKAACVIRDDVDNLATQLELIARLTTVLRMTDPTALAEHLRATLTIYDGSIITEEKKKHRDNNLEDSIFNLEL